MEAPKGFQCSIVNPQKHPAAAPPKNLKHEIYNDPYVFTKVDLHAAQVASCEHKRFVDLMYHLIYSTTLNDLERARAIFRWLTTKNLREIRFAEEAPGTPEEILTNFKRKRGSYARVFELMCIYSGMHCVTVSGHAKGVDCRAGQRLNGTPANHTWNVVLINGDWQLVDSHWATRYVLADRNVPSNVIYEYDDYYFLTEPQQLVLSHFPEDPKWQLLVAPISFEMFDELPLVKSQFFKTGSDLLKQLHGTVRTHRGELKMTLGFNLPNVLYTYKVTSIETGEEIYKGHDLKMYVIQEQRLKSGELRFYFRLPVTAPLYFTVFAALINHNDSARCSTVEQVFRAACEYRVMADGPSPISRTVPQCHDTLWGVTVLTPAQFGLVPSVTDGVLHTSKPTVELRFSRVSPLGAATRLIAKVRRAVRRGASAASQNAEDDVLDSCIQQSETPNEMIFSVQLPKAGEYGLEFYANVPERDHDTFTHLAQYLVAFAPPGSPFATETQLHELYCYESDRTTQSIGAVQPLYLQHQVADAAVCDDLLKPVWATDPNSRIMLAKSSPAAQCSTKCRYIPSVSFALPERSGHKMAEPLIEYTDEELKRLAPVQAYKPEASTAKWSSKNLDNAPQNFKAQRVSKLTDDVPKPNPVVDRDTIYRASASIDDTLVAFDRVDSHAVAVSRMEYANFDELIWALIYARNVTDELEKVRAIYLWLCSKDLQQLKFASQPASGSPEDLLMGIRSGRTTYAHAFELLCAFAGLHSVIVTGYAKGAEYEPGMKFDGNMGKHSWNAVMVNGIWRLVDCNWSARRVIGSHSDSENVKYELDQFYFLPNPAQLIYSHMPDQRDWQLLYNPLSITEFESLAPVKSAFFKLGLEFVSHRHAVINASRELEVRLSYPRYRVNRIAFTFSLAHDNGDDQFKGGKLNRFGMCEIDGCQAVFRVRFPESRAYKLVIYAKEVHPNSARPNDDKVYSAVCEFKVLAGGFQPHEALPAYPPCQNTLYGPNDLARRYAIQADRNEAHLHTYNGAVELRFKLSKPLRFMGKLKTLSPNVDEATLEGCVITRTIKDSEVKFSLYLPEKGEFAIEIYANDPAVDGNTLFHIWQYLITSDVKCATASQLPALSGGYLGAQAKFNGLSLSPINYLDPYIVSKTSEVLLQFGTRQPLRTTVQLLHCKPNAQPEDVSSYVLQQSSTRESKLYVFVRLPHAGFYKLQLFALPANDPAESLPNVYNYLVQYTQTQLGAVAPLAFPKQFASWKQGCYLHEPLDAQLRIAASALENDQNQQLVHFRLEVPNATAVQVVIGDDWHPLEKSAGAGNTTVFSGDLSLAKYANRHDRVSVCANFGENSSNYSTLLEYAL